MYIDPIDDKRRDEAVSTNMQAVMAAMLAIRQNSVLKSDVPLPLDTVGSNTQDSALATAARIARLTRLVMTEQARGQKTQEQGHVAEADADKHLRHAKEQAQETSQQDTFAQDEAVQNRDAARVFHTQSQETAASFGGSRQADRMAAFLKARGYEKLKKAGTDPTQVKQALDDLHEAGIDEDFAAEAYHAISSQTRNFDSDAALADLLANYRGGARSPGAAGPARRKDDAETAAPTAQQVAQDVPFVLQAEEMPWNITPVKT